jgi:5-methyltetrahydropteroyltriglutamate--homocysteine methyltransferase
MKRSTGNLLTTHVGSLPRPADLLENPSVDAARLRKAVVDVVRQQADVGIDVVDDGEFSKPSFVTYVRERLEGMAPTGGVRPGLWGQSRDARAFPEFYARQVGGVVNQPNYGCVGPISYKGEALLKTDLENLKAALGAVKVAEAFVPSISPANIESWNVNKFYKTDEEYRTALADAMRVEYKAIVDAGFILQVDDPRLITYYMMNPEISLKDIRKWASMQVEALNYALRGIPLEKIRYHTCYSINMAPRVGDMPVKDILDIILKVKAGAFSFEASNPRHEHEWTVWRDAKKREGTILLPGVVTHCSLLVETPELVAERLVKYVNFAGKENIIASTDCGFATFASADEIDPAIAWAKLDALVKGAELASKQLRSRPAKSAPRRVAAKKAARGGRKVPVRKAKKATGRVKKRARR